MIIPLKQLLAFNTNRYILAKAMMQAVEKTGNMKDYPTDDSAWKIVPNVLKLVLGKSVNYTVEEADDEE
ncbi:MAG TPA: hypothetical protein PKM65_02635 [Spirochaetota bacterium]|nr:hypothetical protein [Spirochaetota bacterium]HNT12019.1 hypothetical protein [Spirochaetota bacterium]HNV47828.1 hypothetical protein [Spirochaetota bacterium]HOS40031.1 hypothetical protein [Spirochaetota bacterium]HPU88009.1 hypothetical protein [Spirochaetota bacterium]